MIGVYAFLEVIFGDYLGWMGLRAYTYNEGLEDRSIKAIGYPRDPGNSLLQFYTLGNISNVSTKKFDISAKVVRGMSGGPIAETSDNYAVGIIKGFYEIRPGTGIETRITDNILNLVKERR